MFFRNKLTLVAAQNCEHHQSTELLKKAKNFALNQNQPLAKDCWDPTSGAP